MRKTLLLMLGLMLPPAALAGPDYWVIDLSWSPQYCSNNLSSKAPQCTEERYFALNGLEPKFYAEPPPCADEKMLSRETIAAALVFFPNGPLLQNKWRRQGACSGLTQEQYFIELDRASRRLLTPAPYLGLKENLDTSLADLRQQFIAANPGLTEAAIVPQCNGRWLRNLLVCVDTDFNFHTCGIDVADKCRDALRLRKINPTRVGNLPE